jgi:hypothetical protein
VRGVKAKKFPITCDFRWQAGGLAVLQIPA